MAWVRNLNMGRVSVHIHNLLTNGFRIIGKINAVANGLGHLGLAISTRETTAGLIFRQHNIRLYQSLTAINHVEAANDFLTLLQHRQLVLTYWNQSCLKSSNIGGLADRICKEAHWNTLFKVLLLNLSLNGRISLHTGNRNKIHVVGGKLSKLRHLGLNEQSGFSWVKTYRKVVKSNLQDVLTNLLRILKIISQGLNISNHNVDLIKLPGILQLNSALQRTYIMTYVKSASWSVTS